MSIVRLDEASPKVPNYRDSPALMRSSLQNKIKVVANSQQRRESRGRGGSSRPFSLLKKIPKTYAGSLWTTLGSRTAHKSLLSALANNFGQALENVDLKIRQNNQAHTVQLTAGDGTSTANYRFIETLGTVGSRIKEE